MVNTIDNRRSEYTKKIIYDEFMSLLNEKDLERISVKELCDRCGINRGTFYRYYKDIYDLYEKIENQLWQSLSNELKDTVREDEVWLEQILNILRNNKDAVILIIRRRAGGSILNNLWELLEDYALQQIRLNYHNMNEQEINLAFVFISQGAIALIIEWLENYPDIPSKNIADIILNKLIKQSN